MANTTIKKPVKQVEALQANGESELQNGHSKNGTQQEAKAQSCLKVMKTL